jgi:hypothetical protein
LIGLPVDIEVAQEADRFSKTQLRSSFAPAAGLSLNDLANLDTAAESRGLNPFGELKRAIDVVRRPPTAGRYRARVGLAPLTPGSVSRIS